VVQKIRFFRSMIVPDKGLLNVCMICAKNDTDTTGISHTSLPKLSKSLDVCQSYSMAS